MILSQKNTFSLDITAAKKKWFLLDFFYKDFKLYARNSQKVFEKTDCRLVESRRYEGMSDPSDSSILFLITCNNSSKGCLSSGYGIYVETDVIDFILSLKRTDL